MSTRETGISGEELAREFLEKLGLRFHAANVRSPFGEMDLIMEDPTKNELVFVEVKTRHGTQFGRPEDSVTAGKLRKLRQLVEWYSQKIRWPGNVRLDVVGILFGKDSQPTITHTMYVG